ncbi:MAG: AMP-binding protein, partial [Polyangiaceae bacterium]
MLFEPRFHTLVEILESALEAHSHRPLFGTRPTTYGSSQWRWTSYAEFGSMVDRFRAGLASLGVKRGDKVAIVANNRIEWAVAAYASYGLGAAFVPMYEAQSPKEWDFIVRDCEAKVLIVANDAICAKAEAGKVSLANVPSLTHVVVLDKAQNGNGTGNGNGSGGS